MATQRDALRVYLEADPTLTGILTGGIYDASELDQNGLPDGGLLMDARGRYLPWVVIRWRTANATEIIRHSERRFVEVYFYDQTGYANIEAAKRQVKALLDGHPVGGADDAQMNTFHWVSDLGDFVADEYEGAAADRSTYYVDYTRK